MTQPMSAATAARLHRAKDGVVVDGWTRIGTQDLASSRWLTNHYLVVRDADGAHWGASYGIGLTEYQENSLPWEDFPDMPVELDRLYPQQVTVTQYVTAAPEGSCSA